MEMMKIFLLTAILMSSATASGTSKTLETLIAELNAILANNNVNLKYPGRDLALNKNASQSSLIDGYGIASNAVNGKTNGYWYNSECTGTKSEAQPWWQVDLGGKMYFSRIVLYNRKDCCGDRLANFDVKVKGETGDWTEVKHYAGAVGTGHKISFTINMAFARYVRVQLRGTNYLTLCGVEVYAA